MNDSSTNAAIAVLATATTFRGQTIRGLVEVSITPGIGINLVGLADVAVKESLLRVVTALQAQGYHFPGKKVVINLHRDPQFSRRVHGMDDGGWFDLPIALGILLASGQVKASKKELDETIFVGRLNLDGRIVAPASGFLHDADAARAVSWAYRDEQSVWGWDTGNNGGDTWLDVKDLKDAVELLESALNDEEASHE